MSRKTYNITVSKIDRYFTWTSKSEGHWFNSETGTYVSVKRSPIGIWCYLNHNGVKHGEYCKSYSGLNNFIKMIRLIG